MSQRRGSVPMTSQSVLMDSARIQATLLLLDTDPWNTVVIPAHLTEDQFKVVRLLHGKCADSRLELPLGDLLRDALNLFSWLFDDPLDSMHPDDLRALQIELPHMRGILSLENAHKWRSAPLTCRTPLIIFCPCCLI